MENKTDSSFERSIIFRVVAIIVCIIIAGRKSQQLVSINTVYLCAIYRKLCHII